MNDHLCRPCPCPSQPAKDSCPEYVLQTTTFRAVVCPRCHAGVSQPCRTANGRELPNVHWVRQYAVIKHLERGDA